MLASGNLDPALPEALLAAGVGVVDELGPPSFWPAPENVAAPLGALGASGKLPVALA
jgi:hypothetical protein